MSENQRDPQYKLRWPAELRDKISESAKQNNRSMNAEILLRLENSFLLLSEPTDGFERHIETSKNVSMPMSIKSLDPIPMFNLEEVKKILNEIQESQEKVLESAKELHNLAKNR